MSYIDNQPNHDQALLEKLKALSLYIHPKTHDFKAVLDAIPEKSADRIASPFAFKNWRVLAVAVPVILVCALLGVTAGFRAVFFPKSSEVAVQEPTSAGPFSGQVEPTALPDTASRSALIQNLSRVLENESTQEQQIAYADETTPFVASDAQGVETISSLYTSYEY